MQSEVGIVTGAGKSVRLSSSAPNRAVADEPTGNLDSVTAEEVFTLFRRLVDEGRTIVMVTHDHDLAARTRRTVHMVDGEILDGTLVDDAAGDTAPEVVAPA